MDAFVACGLWELLSHDDTIPSPSVHFKGHDVYKTTLVQALSMASGQ